MMIGHTLQKKKKESSMHGKKGGVIIFFLFEYFKIYSASKKPPTWKSK